MLNDLNLNPENGKNNNTATGSPDHQTANSLAPNYDNNTLQGPTNFGMSVDSQDQKIPSKLKHQQLSEVPELTNTIAHENDASAKHNLAAPSTKYGDEMNS